MPNPDNLIVIDIMVLSTELAHESLKEHFNIYTEAQEDQIYKDIFSETLVYTEEAQDKFNELYDKYFSAIKENIHDELQSKT